MKRFAENDEMRWNQALYCKNPLEINEEIAKTERGRGEKEMKYLTKHDGIVGSINWN